MAEYEWRCAGCGVLSPDKIRSCTCPTNVVIWDRETAWKQDTLEDRPPHKTMTAEEYLAANIKGWHEVCWRIDNAGNVGVRYLGC